MIGACAVSAQAFRFEPISQDFAPSGAGASHVFRVTNTMTERIAVRVSVRPRRIERDGVEVQGPESDQFLVYPRQMLLAPGEARSVRVRWEGPATPSGEQAFRIIAEQLPVDFGGEQPAQGAGIRLTYRYEGALYVVPPGAAPDLSLTAARAVDRDGERVLVLEVSNTGTRRTLLHEASVTVRTPNGEMVIGADRLPGMAGENMLAGSTREFIVPAPDGLPIGPLDATLDYTARF